MEGAASGPLPTMDRPSGSVGAPGRAGADPVQPADSERATGGAGPAAGAGLGPARAAESVPPRLAAPRRIRRAPDHPLAAVSGPVAERRCLRAAVRASGEGAAADRAAPGCGAWRAGGIYQGAAWQRTSLSLTLAF